jgi:hypothetical protein
MGREVERWDPPNQAAEKFPIPLWGASSKHINTGDLYGPVFPVRRSNDFAEKAPKSTAPAVPTALSYPKHHISKSDHKYQCDVISDIKLPKLLIGPKLIEEGKNGFVATTPISENIPQFNSPILIVTIKAVKLGGVTASNHYPSVKGLIGKPDKIASEPLMSTPMFPVEHGSKYTTQHFGCTGKGLTIHRQKILASPGNRDTGDRNSCIIEAKNKYSLEELQNGFPKATKTGSILSLSGPKYI